MDSIPRLVVYLRFYRYIEKNYFQQYFNLHFENLKKNKKINALKNLFNHNLGLKGYSTRHTERNAKTID